MTKLLKYFFCMILIQIILILQISGQQNVITPDQINAKLKAATVLISNNGIKLPAFFIADKVLLTYPGAIDNFTGSTMDLNLNNRIISVNFSNGTPLRNNSDWTLIKLSGQNISELQYEILKFADQIPAYPSKFYSYIPFSDYASNQILYVSGRFISTVPEFCRSERAGTPVVNNQGHVFGFFQSNSPTTMGNNCPFSELISFIDVFSGYGTNIVTTPLANSNSGSIDVTIPRNILFQPKLVKIFKDNKSYPLLFISPKHFMVPKLTFPGSDLNVAFIFNNRNDNNKTSIKFKKVYEDPFSNICVMKISFPVDFTIAETNSNISEIPVSMGTRVFSNLGGNSFKEDFVRQLEIAQNGTGIFSIGGYNPLDAYVFNHQGNLIGMVMGEKNGKAIVRDITTLRQAILQAISN